MHKIQLTHIRNNIINGNRKDAVNMANEYGEKFTLDYLHYLQSLELYDSQVLKELENILHLINFYKEG